MLIIGHRGACGYKPENTRASFVKAIEQNVGMIEFDVRRCRSGEVVVIHDETVDRTTNGTGRVRDLTLSQLRNLDAGEGEKISTLEEVIQFAGTKVKLNIELKERNMAEEVAAIISRCVTENNWKFSDFLVSAFDYRQLVKFQLLEPYIPVAANLDGEVPEYFWKHLREMQAFSVHPGIDGLVKPLVEMAHEKGLKVYTWTVNTEAQFEKAKASGVDGIFTDFPDKWI